MSDNTKVNDQCRVLYTSFQPYTVGLAKLLYKEFTWNPVYWFTSDLNESLVMSAFPKAIRHNYINAVKGVPPIEVSGIELDFLDPKVIQELQWAEQISLYMMERNDSNSESFAYKDRLNFYYYLIQYWQTVLNKFNVEVVVFEEEPHQANDYVLYAVCRLLKIRTIITVRTISDLGIIPMEKFEAGSIVLQEEYQRQIALHENEDEVILPDNLSHYLDKLNGSYDEVLQDHLWDQVDRVHQLKFQLNFLVVWYKRAMGILKKLGDWDTNKTRMSYLFQNTYESDQKELMKPLHESKLGYAKAIFYKYRSIARKTANRKYYESLVGENLDLTSPYIFCALQYQPEKSTCPLGGQFVDQYLMVQLLSGLLPDDWVLYVKEHPSQFVTDYTRYGECFRGSQYYDRLLQLKNVRFVSLEQDMFDLIDNSKAVASVGGTVCWEAALRGTPALTFGSAWFCDCEGIKRVYNANDVKKFIDLLVQGKSIDRKKIRLFIKSLSELGFNGAIGGEGQLVHMGITVEENSVVHFNAISRLLMQCQ